MVRRRIKVLGLMCLAAGAFACSKTQDTAPERRIFGTPPTIESVEITSVPASPVTCPWTLQAMDALCKTLPDFAELGLNLTGLPDPFPAITVNVTYTEINFRVKVTDPESTPAQNDILLVTASYLTNQDGTPQEVSLVVLDDGSTNLFNFQQKADFYGENCTAVEFACPACEVKNYALTSNDMTAGDGLYSRGFAFKLLSGSGVPAGARASGLLEDCLVSVKKQAPEESTSLGGAPVNFKIEAIDRGGNIAEWPVKPEVAIQPTSMSCTGDECMCCLLTTSDFLSGCRGRPGLIGPPGSGYEVGLCKLF